MSKKQGQQNNMKPGFNADFHYMADDINIFNRNILFIYRITRNEVEHCDTSGVLKWLFELLEPSTMSLMKNSVLITFDGYEDDHRGLFEIKECRDFMAILNKEWQYWLYFIPIEYVATVIFPLLHKTNPERISNGFRHIYSKENSDYIFYYLGILNSLADNGLVTEDELKGIWQQAMLVFFHMTEAEFNRLYAS